MREIDHHLNVVLQDSAPRVDWAHNLFPNFCSQICPQECGPVDSKIQSFLDADPRTGRWYPMPYVGGSFVDIWLVFPGLVKFVALSLIFEEKKYSTPWFPKQSLETPISKKYPPVIPYYELPPPMHACFHSPPLKIEHGIHRPRASVSWK